MEEIAPYADIIGDFGFGGVALIIIWAFYTDRIITIGNHDKQMKREEALRQISERREEEMNKRYDALLNIALSSNEMAKRAAGIAESRVQQ